jgi:hypothetical protein
MGCGVGSSGGCVEITETPRCARVERAEVADWAKRGWLGKMGGRVVGAGVGVGVAG